MIMNNMELSHAYIDQRKHEIWEQPDHFICPQFGVISKASCIKRQKLVDKINKPNFFLNMPELESLYLCKDCPQGKEIKENQDKEKHENFI